MQENDQPKRVRAPRDTRPLDVLLGAINEHVRAGYDVIMPDGHIINKNERAARALVEAEIPT